MKQAMVVIGCLVVGLQFKLWCEHDGVLGVSTLNQAIAQQQSVNERLNIKNLALQAQVSDLKQGSNAIEERARNELGFVKKGEVFFQFVQQT